MYFMSVRPASCLCGLPAQSRRRGVGGPCARSSLERRPGPFEATIDEDGSTRLRDRYVVSAPLAGRLHRITPREGDDVPVGAVVATLTPVLSPLLDERTLRESQGGCAAGAHRGAA